MQPQEFDVKTQGKWSVYRLVVIGFAMPVLGLVIHNLGMLIAAPPILFAALVLFLYFRSSHNRDHVI